MNWKKHGKIFDPTDYKLANNCLEFAQSPQTLVFKDLRLNSSIMSQFINKNASTDGNVLTIKTVQIAPFRTLMTALKDILL